MTRHVLENKREFISHEDVESNLSKLYYNVKAIMLHIEPNKASILEEMMNLVEKLTKYYSEDGTLNKMTDEDGVRILELRDDIFDKYLNECTYEVESIQYLADMVCYYASVPIDKYFYTFEINIKGESYYNSSDDRKILTHRELEKSLSRLHFALKAVMLKVSPIVSSELKEMEDIVLKLIDDYSKNGNYKVDKNRLLELRNIILDKYISYGPDEVEVIRVYTDIINTYAEYPVDKYFCISDIN